MARGSNSHHVLPLFCDDLIASTVDMTPGCFGAYMRLLCYAWTRGGVPNDEQACSRIAGGFGKGDWKVIRHRLTVIDAGTDAERLSHQRLELERAAVAELKEAKSRSGQEGARRRWTPRQTKPADGRPIVSPLANEWQADGRPIVSPLAKRCEGNGETIAPTPTPTPTPSLREECRTHTHPPGGGFPGIGQPAERWERFATAWNRTERAVPWTPVLPPDGWNEMERIPGWLDRAAAALGMLPRCEFFDRPLAITKFFGYVDRIIAGEFNEPKGSKRERRKVAGGNL